MNGSKFYEMIQKHDELEWFGVREEKNEVVIANKTTGAKLVVGAKAILDHSWRDIEAVLLGRREPFIMRHFTRIVGYFSTTRNWNLSKIRELADRGRGMYAVPEDHVEVRNERQEQKQEDKTLVGAGAV